MMGPGFSDWRGEKPREIPDHVAEMDEWRRRHRHVTWLRPGQAGVAEHTATWLEADADPAIDGAPVTVTLPLGSLLAFLRARFGE